MDSLEMRDVAPVLLDCKFLKLCAKWLLQWSASHQVYDNTSIWTWLTTFNVVDLKLWGVQQKMKISSSRKCWKKCFWQQLSTHKRLCQRPHSDSQLHWCYRYVMRWACVKFWNILSAVCIFGIFWLLTLNVLLDSKGFVHRLFLSNADCSVQP